MAVPLSPSSTPVEMSVTPPPHLGPSQQSIVTTTSAPEGAGGPTVKSRREELFALTMVSTKLEVLCKMYERLLRSGSGTGTIESEAMSIVWERMIGPTGHPLIVNALSDNKLSQEDCDTVMIMESDGQCWRDVELVRSLVRVRLEVVRKQWKESQSKHSTSARVLSVTTNKTEMKEIWDQVVKIRRETWRHEDCTHQRKTTHLAKKSRDCAKHKMCQAINQLVVDRANNWVLGTVSQPRECESGATLKTPRLRPVHLERSDDLSQLLDEEEQVISLTEEFNQKLKYDDQDAKDEVVIFGSVKLNEDEISLLNLGPGYMVTKPLDIDEMEVEAVVTLTKIRWGRRKEGLDEMSDKEIQDYLSENPADTDEENLAEMVEAAARDVVEEETLSINMLKKRATDMKNNRHVHMPGPAPA